LPELRAEVVVVGGGPGGAAAALELARAGARVVICDRARFPRDKVCGDGLLPDAWRALESLGVAAAVAEAAYPARGIAFRAPGGREGFVPVEARVTRRLDLDGRVLAAAVSAGAEVVDRASLVAVEPGVGRWRAARFATAGGELVVAAEWFLLATGAAPRPRQVAGLRGGGRPGGAVRCYATGVDRDPDALLIQFRESLPCGYYWAFPVGGGIWNVGCGTFSGSGGGSLVDLAGDFAAGLGASLVERPRGAPLATAFPGLEVARANLLAVGDAAGLTRPFSGEGIGPALLSGSMAAACVVRGGDPAAEYRRRLRRRFGREYAAWRLGERLLAHPRAVNAIVSRVEGSRRARERIKAVLADRMPSDAVLSPWGVVRLLLGR